MLKPRSPLAWPAWCLALARSARVFAVDVGHGALEISHNSLALVGLSVVAAALFIGGSAPLRAMVEDRLMVLLQARQEARADALGDLLNGVSEPEAVGRATALDPASLPAPQAAVVQWLSKRYRVAPEPLGRLVHEAWAIGRRAGLDPTLILAIMAIESGFNPFAQSAMGAQGLMQVMTRVHDDKFSAFGGQLATFDPVTNLKVGVQVLKECIHRAGSLNAGLRLYVGAGQQEEDGGYVSRVLAEQGHLRSVADGKVVPVSVPTTLSAPVASAKLDPVVPPISPISPISPIPPTPN